MAFANEDAGDQCTAGLNFVPLRPRRAVLEDDRAVLKAIYAPAAYFERVRIVGRRLRRANHQVTPVARIVMRDLMTLLRLMGRMTIQKSDLRRFFWRTFIDTARHNAPALHQVVSQMALYLHLGPFSRFVVQELDQQIGAIDEEPSVREPVWAAEVNFKGRPYD